jgi:hypothetical protein
VIDLDLAVALVIEHNADPAKFRAAIGWHVDPPSGYGLVYYGNAQNRAAVSVGVSRGDTAVFLAFLEQRACERLSPEAAAESIANVQQAIALRTLRRLP